jgi:hypothetical protein
MVYRVQAGKDGESEMSELYIDTEHLRDFASVWDGDKLVADFYATGAVANAQLFIAAQELLEVCKKARERIERIRQNALPYESFYSNEAESIVRRLDAAIAKAETHAS